MAGLFHIGSIKKNGQNLTLDPPPYPPYPYFFFSFFFAEIISDFQNPISMVLGSESYCNHLFGNWELIIWYSICENTTGKTTTYLKKVIDGNKGFKNLQIQKPRTK